MNERDEMRLHAALRQIRRWSAFTAIAFAMIALAACSAGGKGHGSAARSLAGAATSTNDAAAVGDVAQFCQDYSAAVDAYYKNLGDVTDPSFDQFLTLLAKAKAEAPPAVQSQVATMYTIAVAVKESNGTGDLTSESQVVSDWADTNCSGPSPKPAAASSRPASPGGSDGSDATGSATADPAGFCSLAWDVIDNLNTLETRGVAGGVDGNPTPTASDWQSANSAVHDLAARASLAQGGTLTVQEDVNAIGTDLDDIIANGFDNSNGGANLAQDLGAVQTDASSLGCQAPR
jgi:hypothetical protein